MASSLAKVTLPPRAHRLAEQRFMGTWRHAQRHLRAHYLHGGRAPALESVVELGTIGYPIVPVGLALTGARRVTAFDLAPRFDAARVLATLKMFRHLAGAGRLPALEPDACDRLDEVLARAAGRSAQWMLGAFGLSVRRADARRTGLPRGSVDLFVSSNALEHLPRPTAAAIFREFRRVGHDASVMSHLSERPLPDARQLHRDTRWLILEEEPGWIASSPAPLRVH